MPQCCFILPACWDKLTNDCSIFLCFYQAVKSWVLLFCFYYSRTYLWFLNCWHFLVFFFILTHLLTFWAGWWIYSWHGPCHNTKFMAKSLIIIFLKYKMQCLRFFPFIIYGHSLHHNKISCYSAWNLDLWWKNWQSSSKDF